MANPIPERQPQAADAAMAVAAAFNRVFTNGDGVMVLEILDSRFRAQRIYQSGGLDGQRETDRRAAQKEVVDFIYAQIARAQRGDPNAAE